MASDISVDLARRLFRYDAERGYLLWNCRHGSKVHPGMKAGYRDGKYCRVEFGGRKYSVHRLIWIVVHGCLPQHQIDHIDGNSHNNRLENLRDVPPDVNCQNKRRPASSNRLGVLGVIRDPRGTFRASIEVAGRCKTLGRFATADEAHVAYLAAKRQLHEGCTL